MNSEIKCPICMEAPLYPRLYECGHTVCEICMQNHDHAETDRNYNIFQATNFTCPICRKTSITPWYLRPINRALLDILLKDTEYIKNHEEYVCKRVDISTKASIKEMVLPGLLAIAVPVIVGFGGKWFGIGGAEMLGGLLAGVTTCGVLMAIFQSNAGGAWDNAKKMIEEAGQKGTEAHKAAVVGDTVGDPFKDTSGPSLNILLKLISVVALVIAPLLV